MCWRDGLRAVEVECTSRKSLSDSELHASGENGVACRWVSKIGLVKFSGRLTNYRHGKRA